MTLSYAYANTGRSAFLNEDFISAYDFTNEAYLIRHYELTTSTKKKLDTIKQRLSDCEEKLADLDSSTQAITSERFNA